MSEWSTEQWGWKIDVPLAILAYFSFRLVLKRTTLTDWNCLIISTVSWLEFRVQVHKRNRFRKSTASRSTWDPYRPCSTIQGSVLPLHSRSGSYWVHRRSNWWKSTGDRSIARRNFLLLPGPFPMSRNVHCQNLFRMVNPLFALCRYKSSDFDIHFFSAWRNWSHFKVKFDQRYDQNKRYGLLIAASWKVKILKSMPMKYFSVWYSFF